MLYIHYDELVEQKVVDDAGEVFHFKTAQRQHECADVEMGRDSEFVHQILWKMNKTDKLSDKLFLYNL